MSRSTTATAVLLFAMALAANGGLYAANGPGPTEGSAGIAPAAVEGAATECCDPCPRCHGCHRACDCCACQMPPHYPHFPPLNGYYYFRPYNYPQLAPQQQFVMSWGGDPRDPYKNEIFQRVYAAYKAETKKEPAAAPGKPKTAAGPRTK
jgi:hypothetical protein